MLHTRQVVATSNSRTLVHHPEHTHTSDQSAAKPWALSARVFTTSCKAGRQEVLQAFFTVHRSDRPKTDLQRLDLLLDLLGVLRLHDRLELVDCLLHVCLHVLRDLVLVLQQVLLGAEKKKKFGEERHAAGIAVIGTNQHGLLLLRVQ